jgi:hypothetical protein
MSGCWRLVSPKAAVGGVGSDDAVTRRVNRPGQAESQRPGHGSRDGRHPALNFRLRCCRIKGIIRQRGNRGRGGRMDEGKYEIEVLPATVSSDAARDLVVHADLERLRREVAAPPIVRAAGPGAEYAYADFFKGSHNHRNRNAR